MTRILVYEPSYRRLEARFAPHAAKLEFLLMQPDGAILLDGAPVGVDEARPEIGWLNTDLFGQGPGRDYMIALLKSPALRWVQSGAAGFENPAFAQVVGKGAVLTTNHSQSIGMAEYVLATVLDHLQRGPDRRKAQAEHRWAPMLFREVAGTNWLIVGFGAIGQGVAERVRPFGATVIGCRRTPGDNPLADRMVALADVKSAVPEADVVVLSVPLNSETRSMADAAFLAAMKPESVLVNVGRGDLVDEPALLAALEKGVPAFAVLDVFHQEPLPQDSPFWDHPKVALNPHASAFGSGQSARNDALFLENLRRQFAGEALLYPADPRDLGR
jgi:phosphoglycerate dehydrogenase-like enzyme